MLRNQKVIRGLGIGNAKQHWKRNPFERRGLADEEPQDVGVTNKL
jgi:hypothetical protein